MSTSTWARVAATTAVIATSTLAGCAAPAEDETDEIESTDASQTEEALVAGCEHCRIIPGTSIRGISLGMSKKQVRDVLGTPTSVDRYPGYPAYAYHYGATMIHFYDVSSVDFITTTSKKVRTRDGLGVGSTKAQLKDRYPNINCVPGGPFAPFCYLGGSLAPGATPTVFVLSNAGVVSEVRLYSAEG